MRKWFVSWIYHYESMGHFALYTPWWRRRHVNLIQFIQACLKAEDKKEVEEIVYNCHDKRPDRIHFLFIDKMPSDWEGPRSDLFVWEKWMERYWARDEYRQSQ